MEFLGNPERGYGTGNWKEVLRSTKSIIGPQFLYAYQLTCKLDRQQNKLYIMESLILAQNERWRRG